MFIAQQKSLTIGGRTYSQAEMSGIFILVGTVLTAGRWGGLIKANQTTAFQAPSDTGYYIRAVKTFKSETTSNNSGAVAIGYSDDAATVDDPSVTNPVYMGGSVSIFSASIANLSQTSGEIGGIDFHVIPNKYGFINGFGTANMSAIAYCSLTI